MKAKLLVVPMLLWSALSAAPITGLFNTGQSTTGSADNYWTIVAPPGAGQVVSPVFVPSTWVPNTLASNWEWATNTGQPTGSPPNPVIYTFRHLLLIDSTFNAATTVVTGRWTTDNVGTQILVNGHVFNQTSPDYTAWSSFTLNSSFVSGLNIIDFVVEDYGSIGGFRVEFLSADASLNALPTPEPGTWILLGVGLIAIGYRRRHQA